MSGHRRSGITVPGLHFCTHFISNSSNIIKRRRYSLYCYLDYTHCCLFIIYFVPEYRSTVANPPRGQLNMKSIFSLTPFAPDNLVSRDRFSCHVPHVSPLFFHTGFLPLSRRCPFIYMYRGPPSGSPEFIRLRTCVPMAFTAESLPAQSQ